MSACACVCDTMRYVCTYIMCECMGMCDVMNAREMCVCVCVCVCMHEVICVCRHVSVLGACAHHVCVRSVKVAHASVMIHDMHVQPTYVPVGVGSHLKHFNVPFTFGLKSPQNNV